MWGARAAGDRTGGGTVLEDDETLHRVQRKVLDLDTEVVHDQPRLAGHATRQPRRHQSPRRTEFLQRFREQSPPLVRTHGSAPLALQMRGARSAGQGRLRAARAADLGTRLWLVRVRLEARRRARPRQVRCDIGG